MTLAELLEAATPGPWDVSTDHQVWRWVDEDDHTPLGIFEQWDDALLASLAPDLARLALDMGEALRTLLDG